MDFSWTEEDTAFAKELYEFCEHEVPSWFKGHYIGGDEEKDFCIQFCKKMGERGWLTMAWPKEYGGGDAPIWPQMILKETMAAFGEPRGGQYMNVNWIGPSIMLHGTDEQKDYHLDRISKGDVIWCQGFSEPDAGSDLASLQTRAVQDGDDFVINGQKTWTSNAERAEFCYLIARTDPEAPKHRGLTAFLVPMNSPGLTVRKIRSMSGYGNVNEVFFDDVRVSRSTMLGGLNEGWRVSMAALNFERTGYASDGTLRQVIRFAKETEYDGKPLSKDPAVRQKIAAAYGRYRTARVVTYRQASVVAKGDDPGPGEASMASMHTRLNMKGSAELSMEIMGLYGQLQVGAPDAPFDGKLEGLWRHSISSTIAGGTMEIQKENVAVRGLGLPR